ncbi:MAG TPA: hypothetical protein VFN31_02350 [Candidatus Saccharimonadales bacterium]|nr:hypothetical protein [Candidatus Saccharimonadales bacterium]
MAGQKTSNRDRLNVVNLSRRINALNEPLEQLVSLGSYYGIKPIAEIRIEELAEPARSLVVHKKVFSRSPYVLLGNDHNGHVSVGLIEKIQHSKSYLFPGQNSLYYPSASRYKGVISSVSSTVSEMLQEEPVRGISIKADEVEAINFPTVEDLWGTLRRHDPFGLLFNIQRGIRVHQIANSLPACENMAEIILTAAQDSNLNPMLQADDCPEAIETN